MSHLKPYLLRPEQKASGSRSKQLSRAHMRCLPQSLERTSGRSVASSHAASHASHASNADLGPPPAPSASSLASATALAARLGGKPISLADASPFVSLAGGSGTSHYLDPLEESPLEEAAEAFSPKALNPPAAAAGGGSAAGAMVASEEQGTAAQPAAPAGEGAVIMTPRTRARNPMEDIVRLIETGSVRKGAKPAGPTAAVAGATEGVAETGTNLGAAFDKESIAEGEPSGIGVHFLG